MTLGSSCTYLELLRHAYSDAAPPAQTYRLSDGGEAIFFLLDKSLRVPANVPETFVFVISGSDCTSMKYWLPRYFLGLEGESGPMRIFVIHKRLIEERSWGRFLGCSDAFIRMDHPRRWIMDYTEFIESRLAQGRPKRVVLVGISEGGDVVPLLARRLAGVTHVVLLANGGMDPLDAYRMQARANDSTEADDVLASLRDAPPTEQDAVRNRIGGRTWRYWSELRELEPTGNLLALSIPILVGMGEEDRSLPVESARNLRESFVREGKPNLTLVTYEGADHFLVDQRRGISRLPDFWHYVDVWLTRK